MSTTTPIFGIGYMRSGTTLLFNTLRKSGSIFAATSEPNIYEYRSLAKEKFGNSPIQLAIYVNSVVNHGFALDYLTGYRQPIEDVPQEIQEEAESSNPGYLDLFKLVYDYNCSKTQSDHWYAKAQASDLASIKKDFGTFKAVFIVRDPRAVIASKALGKKTIHSTDKYEEGVRDRKNLIIGSNLIADCLAWRSEIRNWMSAKSKVPVGSELTYEELVTNPKETLKRVSAELGIEFTDEMLVPGRTNSSEVGQNKEEGIATVSLEKWKSQLSSSRIRIIEWVCQKELKKYGYSQTSNRWLAMLQIPFYYVGFAFYLLRRIYSQFRLGGWKYGKSMIKYYLKKI